MASGCLGVIPDMTKMFRVLTCNGCRGKSALVGVAVVMLFTFILLQEMQILTKTAEKAPERKLAWLKDTQWLMVRMDEKVLRCKAEDMGCFTLVPEIFATTKYSISRNPCLHSCFKSSSTYAGITSTGTCFCAISLLHFVARISCDASCSADRSKNCTAPTSVRIYRKTRDCEIGFKETWWERNRVGCMEVPTKLTGNMQAWKMKNISKEQCVRKCESQNFQLAMPVQKFQVCICSDLYSLFKTAERMQEAMRSCGDQHGNEEKFSVYQTYAEKGGCEVKKFLKPLQGPYTILTSFWGSGNTWMRHLIESATGIYTGSIYLDDSLYRGGLIGEMTHFLSGRTIVIKDHIMSKPSLVDRHYTSAILLIRNPYDASLAEFTRLFTKNNHTAVINPEIYESQGFKNTAAGLHPKWLYHAQMLFELIPSVLVVYYEDVVKDPVRELRRVVNFLPSEVVQSQGEQFERKLMCMNLDLTGNFRRPPKKFNSDPYTQELKQQFDATIRKMDILLRSKNYTALPISYFDSWNV